MEELQVPSLYVHVKVPNPSDSSKSSWKYIALKEGRGIRTSNLQGPFYTRVSINGRQTGYERLKADTFAEAKVEAAALPNKLRAQQLGVAVADIKATNRVLIKNAIATYMGQINKARKTILQYRNTLDQFAEAIKDRARFLDEIDLDVLRRYKRCLEGEEYAGKTIDTRLNIVFFLLKKNLITVRLPKDEMPTVEDEPAVPYTGDELGKLFSEMQKAGAVETVKGKDYSGPGFGQEIRYRFFLGTGCRDKEVSFATWSDIDWTNRKYHVRGKSDVGFTPKNHETRSIPMPRSLVDLLRARYKDPPDKRWIFVNEEANPENHFLRKLKSIAKNAALNCGHCKHTITKGRYDNRQQVEVTCATDPVCDHYILHRFRKTCATRWMNAKVPIRNIQHYLGHKSLETTMIYLGIEEGEGLQDQIDEAYGD